MGAGKELMDLILSFTFFAALPLVIVPSCTSHQLWVSMSTSLDIMDTCTTRNR